MYKRLLSFLVSLIVSTSCIANASNASQHITSPHKSLAPLLKKIMPAVVNLSIQGSTYKKTSPFSQNDFNSHGEFKNKQHSKYSNNNYQFKSVGSGVIVNAKKGYILTNAHVISDANMITVSLSDGRHLMGKKVGIDTPSDLAVIQVSAKGLKAIPLANSDKIQVGDFVAAIGNPFGLHQTVTAGVISALNRQLGMEGYEDFIQTDAPINPGSSGGALINMKGELIGINTAIISASGGNMGIGFSIPSNMAKSVLDQLIQYGKIQRGLLGVMVQNLTPALAEAFHESDKKGALITQIQPHSSAEKSGLKPNDIIVKINKKSIKNASQVRNAVGVSHIGSSITIEVIRNHKKLNFQATILDPKIIEEKMLAYQSPLNGVHMITYDEIDANTHHIEGVQVVGISKQSLAWFQGIRPGDVILELNHQKTPSVNALLSQIKNKAHESLLIKILRLGSIIYLVLSPT